MKVPVSRDICTLHGLELEEWLRLLFLHSRALAALGRPEEALRTLRLFHHRSVWASQLRGAFRLRLLGLLVAWEGGLLGQALQAARWMARVRAVPSSSGGSHQDPAAPILRLLHALLPMGLRGERLMISRASHKFWVREGKKRHAPDSFRFIAGHVNASHNYPEEAIRCYRQIKGAVASQEPTLKLHLAIALLQSAYRRTSKDPRGEVSEAMQLLRDYYNLGETPEQQYNVARALHSCGFLGVAAHLYQQVLASPASEYTRDAAYALHLIYRDSGSDQLAASILERYIII